MICCKTYYLTFCVFSQICTILWGILQFCACRHVICCHSFICFVSVAYIGVFSPHYSDMTSWQNSSAEKISCNVAPFFYHHSVVIQHFVSDHKIVVSPRVLYKFVNLISTLVICLKLVFIEILDKLITYIVCWYMTLY
jgi:hypothetical protein